MNWEKIADFEDIRLEKTPDGVAKITINRPEVRNAFRPETVNELLVALDIVREDGEVGVVILTGEGDKAFCSGGDQKVRGNAGYVGGDGVPRLNILDVQKKIRALPKPVIAMVAGYAIGGGHTSLAVRAGGLGDVTESRVLWREQGGSNVSSPVYHDGYLYWASDHRGIVYCQNAETGEYAYKSRLTPPSGKFYASPVLVDDRIYYVSQHNGTYVVAAKPEFELLAHNVITDDDSRTNASPVVMDGRLLLRSDRYLYCIGRRQ